MLCRAKQAARSRRDVRGLWGPSEANEGRSLIRLYSSPVQGFSVHGHRWPGSAEVCFQSACKSHGSLSHSFGAEDNTFIVHTRDAEDNPRSTDTPGPSASALSGPERSRAFPRTSAITGYMGSTPAVPLSFSYLGGLPMPSPAAAAKRTVSALGRWQLHGHHQPGVRR